MLAARDSICRRSVMLSGILQQIGMAVLTGGGIHRFHPQPYPAIAAQLPQLG